MIFDESRIVMREDVHKIHAGSRGWVACTPSELKLLMQNTSPITLTETPFDCPRPFAVGQSGGGSMFYRAPDDYVETPCGHVKDQVWERQGNDERIMEYTTQLPVPGCWARITGNGNFWIWVIRVQNEQVHDAIASSLDDAMASCREHWAAMIRYCLYEPTGV